METTQIVLLRGINVGGHKKFSKNAQLQMLQDLGFKKAQVYLHTGNWIVNSTKDALEIENLIYNAIELKYGWKVPILAKKASEIEEIVVKCPFSEEKLLQSYFVLLQAPPLKTVVESTAVLSSEKEIFQITSACVYIYYTEGAGKAKMGNNFFERKLQVNATTRNYRTMAKLIALSINLTS